MSRPGLIEGAVVALGMSTIGAGAVVLLTPVIGHGAALHGVLALAALAYLVYLLRRGRAREGRVVVPLAWALLIALVLLGDASLLTHLLAQAALVWITRTWCFHRSVLCALGDLAVIAAGLAAFAWAAHHGQSLALAVWSLMLVQSLFVVLPSLRGGSHAHPNDANSIHAHPGHADPRDASASDPFEGAHRAAVYALRDLHNRN